MVSLVSRTYLRYVVPATVMSALAFAPLLWLAFKLPLPLDAAHIKGVARTGWLLAALSAAPLLVLAGGVAPLVRSIAAGAPASQPRALYDGLVGLARAVLPAAAALLAIAIGTLAVIVPGAVLLVLLAPAGAAAAPDRSIGETLAASAAAVRARAPQAIAIVAAVGVVAVGALFALQRGVPLRFPRYVIAGYALLAPLPAIALAALTAGSPSARA